MPERWSNTSVALHWLTAALIAGIAIAGFVMSDLPSTSELRLLLSRLHTVFGATLMLLMLARFVVRRRGPTPSPLPLPDLHRRGVSVIHALIYAVTFALGASGFITAARSAWPDYLQGKLAEAPALEQLAAREIHGALVLALLGLVVLHVVGVLLQEGRHGKTLRRMIPFLK